MHLFDNGLKNQIKIQEQNTPFSERRYVEIDLSQNSLTSASAENIVQLCIHSGERLRRLKLYKNYIGDNFIDEFGRILDACPNLEELHLSHNHLTREGVSNLMYELAATMKEKTGANGWQHNGCPFWARLEQNMVVEPCELLIQLEKTGMSICIRADEKACTTRICQYKRLIHVPHLDLQRNEADVADSIPSYIQFDRPSTDRVPVLLLPRDGDAVAVRDGGGYRTDNDHRSERFDDAPPTRHRAGDRYDRGHDHRTNDRGPYDRHDRSRNDHRGDHPRVYDRSRDDREPRREDRKRRHDTIQSHYEEQGPIVVDDDNDDDVLGPMKQARRGVDGGVVRESGDDRRSRGDRGSAQHNEPKWAKGRSLYDDHRDSPKHGTHDTRNYTRAGPRRSRYGGADDDRVYTRDGSGKTNREVRERGFEEDRRRGVAEVSTRSSREMDRAGKNVMRGREGALNADDGDDGHALTGARRIERRGRNEEGHQERREKEDHQNGRRRGNDGADGRGVKSLTHTSGTRMEDRRRGGSKEDKEGATASKNSTRTHSRSTVVYANDKNANDVDARMGARKVSTSTSSTKPSSTSTKLDESVKKLKQKSKSSSSPVEKKRQRILSTSQALKVGSAKKVRSRETQQRISKNGKSSTKQGVKELRKKKLALAKKKRSAELTPRGKKKSSSSVMRKKRSSPPATDDEAEISEVEVSSGPGVTELVEVASSTEVACVPNPRPRNGFGGGGDAPGMTANKEFNNLQPPKQRVTLTKREPPRSPHKLLVPSPKGSPSLTQSPGPDDNLDAEERGGGRPGDPNYLASVKEEVRTPMSGAAAFDTRSIGSQQSNVLSNPLALVTSSVGDRSDARSDDGQSSKQSKNNTSKADNDGDNSSSGSEELVADFSDSYSE